MNEDKFIVFVIKYKERDQEVIDNLVRGIEKPINLRHGEIRRVYEGSEDRIISALESILDLTK